MDAAEKTFSLASGTTFTIERVSPMFVGRVVENARKAHVEEHGEPDCPTYTVPTAGGDDEVWPHTAETMAEEPFSSDDDSLAAWEEYTNQVRAVQIVTTRASLKAYCVRGVKDEPPDEWAEEQEYWGIPVPEDPRDKKWAWLTDLCGWPELLEISATIQSIRSPVEEAARAARASFQRALGESGGTDSGPDSATTEQD